MASNGRPCASTSPAATACRRPSSVRGGSAWPCHRPEAFHAALAVADRQQLGDPLLVGWEDTDAESNAGTIRSMARLRLFAAAREAAGTGTDEFDAATVQAVLTAAVGRYGDGFAAVLDNCKDWLNGDETDLAAPVGPADEVAVLPPVSGGWS